jgi:hypothetical protein
MKYLAILIALLCQISAQSLTNTNLDGVTNATINGVLDDNPGASRTALGLGTAATAASGDFADDGAVFYATRYGVTADGTTNDTVALQAAIDAAHASTNTTRRTVMLPDGVIRLTRTIQIGVGEDKQAINLRPNVNIVGQGMGATVVKLLDSAPYDCPVFLAYSIERINSTLTNASVTVTVSNTSGLCVGMPVSGAGISSTTEIRSIINSTTLTLDKPATTSSTVTLTFFPANIAVKDLTIDGNAFVRFAGGAGGEDEGLNFKGGANILVSQVRVTDCGQDGLDTDAGTDITVSNCVFDRNAGNGIHAVGGGPRRFKVLGCHFLSNGFQRRGTDGLAGSGGGIDTLATELIIDGCTFQNNAVEIQALSGHVTITNTQINHGAASITNSALTASISAIVAGNTTGGAATDASMMVSGCRINSSVASVIQIVNNFPLTQIIGNRIQGATTATSAARVIYNDNYQTGIYGLHLVATSKPALVCGNYFDVGYTNGLRIEASTGGVAQGNHFNATDTGATDVALRSGSTGWKLIGNNFSPTTTGVVSVSNGGSGVSIMGNTGDFKLSLGASTATVKSNQLGAVTWAGNGATGNLFEGNTINSIANSGTVTFASNTWRRNTGAGCVGIFYGTTTLASGTATITSAAANSARKWSLTRQAKNSSTGIGSPSIGTVTAQTSFVIDSLKSDATVETGDLSSVYWEILE